MAASPKVIVAERPLAEELFASLSEPSLFATTLMRPDGAPLALDPWQGAFLRDRAKVISVLKSRRVGGSWAMALKMFVRAVTTPGYHGVFVSMNREEARGKIDYVESFHDALPPRWRLKMTTRSKDEIVFTDAAGRRSVLRSLAGKAPRGRGGDVGISELPHCIGARAIYEGALHVTARRMEDILTVESTPLGKGGVFHELSRGAYGSVARYEIPWWLCAALCTDVAVAAHEAPAMATADRVERFGSRSLKTVYASMTEKAFRQESELAFSDLEEAVFPTELILSCAEADFGDVDATLLFRRVDRVPSHADWQWLAARRSGPLVAGYDPARSRDAAALVILDRVGDRLITRMVVAFTDVPFATQKEVVRAALAHGVTKFSVDATGVGLDLAETLAAEFPHRVEPVTFTAKSKELMVGGAYHAFTDKKLLIPADRDLVAELAAIREEVTPAGGRVYHARRSVAGHADRAWGLLLALFAARTAPTPQPVAYESISRRTRRW